MRHVRSTRTRRPVIVALCVVIRVGRRLRASCGPFVRNAARLAVRIIAHDGDCTATLTAHVIVAAATGAAFSIGAAFAGFGSSELCKIAGAVAVGALAVSAATLLVRAQLGAGNARPALRPLLAGAARQLVREHAQHPAARILRVACGQHRSTAVATVGVALAVLAPALPSLPALTDAQLLVMALKPARRLVPGMNLALDVHGAYRHSRASARFVREFALAAASLCPPPRELPLLAA